MSEHKLPQAVRGENGLVGVKNKTPRKQEYKYIFQHRYNAETKMWSSAGVYRNSDRQAKKEERAARAKKRTEYAKKYLGPRMAWTLEWSEQHCQIIGLDEIGTSKGTYTVKI